MLNEFFASFYQTLHYSDGFSDDLYNEYLYQLLGIVLVASSLAFVLIYYFGLDKVKFASLKFWLIFLVLSTGFNFFYALTAPKNTLDGLGIEYDLNEYLNLALINLLSSLVIFTVGSLIFKLFSTNLKKMPF